MRERYVRWMDRLYLGCIWVAGVSMVLMTLVIPWGVYRRYVLDSAAAWPEPMAILLMVLFTFFAAAAVYRVDGHIAVRLIVDALPARGRRAAERLVLALLALLAAFMVAWGVQLVRATWHQVIADFPWLSVGITYLPLPVGGAFLLLFIVERAWIGPPPDAQAPVSGAGDVR